MSNETIKHIAPPEWERRTWRERFLTWPWRPWVVSKPAKWKTEILPELVANRFDISFTGDALIEAARQQRAQRSPEPR